MKKFNNRLGDILAYGLSTMGCFYIVFALVIVPLFYQHPTDLIGWIQYIIQSIFQGVALPVLGYVARVAGEKQEKVIKETHDASMEELAIVKEELAIAKEEREMIKKLLDKESLQ